jgi:predicted dehydrogenase
LNGVTLAAVCDNKPGRAQESAEANGCLMYTDYRELLKNPDIDAVHICTPHYLHGPMAIDAMRAGKYVLVEKPMACSPAEARAMIDEDERQGGGRLCVVFQNRYNESSRTLKDFVDGGKYGRLLAMRASVVWNRSEEYYSDDWHGKKAYECGGVMINQAIHTLDLVQWICGGARSVKGCVSTDGLMGVIEVEDTAHMLIRMKSGIGAVMYATVAYGVNAPVEIEAVLEEATFLLKGDRLYRTDIGFDLIVSPQGYPIGERDYWGSGHLVQIADFYHCILEGRQFYIDGTQGIEAVKLVCGLYQSSEIGRVVSI